MPRKIASQDPVVKPAEPEVTYDEMEVAMFRVVKTNDGLRLRAALQKVDSEGEVYPDEDFLVKINDLEGQMAVTPKFAAAWDAIVDCMGLAYDFYRLREKVEAAIANGDDATELIAARDAALDTLRGPVE